MATAPERKTIAEAHEELLAAYKQLGKQLGAIGNPTVRDRLAKVAEQINNAVTKLKGVVAE